MSINKITASVMRLAVFAVIVFCAGGCGSTSSPASATTTTPAAPIDYSEPMLQTISPVSASTEVPLNSSISARFNEPVWYSSFTVLTQNDKPVAGVVNGAGTDTLVFTPAKTLNYGTKYIITISGITDAAGNVKTYDTTWSFTSKSIQFTYHTTPDGSSYDLGSNNSIAVYNSPASPTTTAYISAFNNTDRSLYLVTTNYAGDPGTSTPIFTPIANETVGEFSSILSDTNGNLHLVFYHEGFGLKNAASANGGATWSSPAIIDNSALAVGEYPSFVMDSSGFLHVSYYDRTNTALKYATNTSGAWSTETVDSGIPSDNPGMYSSIKIDALGKVHISYYDYHASVTNGNLKYATGSFGNWKTYTLDSSGDCGVFSNIAIDSNGAVFIVYNVDSSTLRIITNSQGSWISYNFISVSAPTPNPVVIDPDNGIIHVAYYSSKNLRHATGVFTSGNWGWSADVIDGNDVGSTGMIATAIDPNGGVHVSYYDKLEKGLKYAHPVN